jgi:hypothetical protein
MRIAAKTAAASCSSRSLSTSRSRSRRLGGEVRLPPPRAVRTIRGCRGSLQPAAASEASTARRMRSPTFKSEAAINSAATAAAA